MVAAAVLALTALLPAQAARRALVVGVSDYVSVPALRNARADAQLMARTLQELGFAVQVSLDPDLKRLQAELRTFRLSAQENDELLFYFAGHGVQIGGSNYLLPADITADHEYQVKDDAPALSRILREIRAKRPRLLLAIVDACRDNPFAAGSTRGLGGTGLSGTTGATGQIVIYAAGEGQRALDRLGPQDPSPNGLFTRVLAQEMRRPGLSIRDVLFRVREEVARLAEAVRHEQVPAIVDQARGDFVFAPAMPGTADAGAPGTSSQAVVRPAANAASAAEVSTAACPYCPAMVRLPGGSFVMGSPFNEPGRNSNEGIQRRIELAPFEISRHEITQGLWQAVMGSNPSRHRSCGPECPVERVSWDEIQPFLAALQARTGVRYALPTEAQWEFAARAGEAGRWGFGDEETELSRHAWLASSGDGQPHPVGRLQPNRFGLFDLHGNVAEWTRDCYSSEASRLDRHHDGRAHEESVCTRRTIRGGSFADGPARSRSAARTNLPSDGRASSVGFRVVRVTD